MNRMGWASTLRGLFRRQKRGRERLRQVRRQQTDRRMESLEQRRLLAVDFVSASVVDGEAFFIAREDQGGASVLNESPQQVTFRFTPGVEIDPSSLDGISVLRSGGRGDGFGSDGNLEDVVVTPGVLLVDDLPARNQVVIRFAETLPDDTYRFKISSEIDPATGEISGLRTTDG